MRKLSPHGVSTLQSGQRIGAYRIIRQLGAGGMGQVYEAEHVALRVRRALKVFSTESEHSEFLRKRFVAEGRILADLQHPRIVRVYDLVVDEDTDMAYFEMDLVLSPDGQPRTLADEQRDGVDEEKVVGWFKDICEGLAYIHSKGVVHRDMSLDNILIGSDGHAVIADFGIAKIIDDSYRRKIDMTATMVAKDGAEFRMGKGLYMAPELKKEGGKATFAADAYAVGVILFRLLFGTWYDMGTCLIKDWFAAFEYDWYSVISQLCNADLKKRLGEDGIGAVLLLLKRTDIENDQNIIVHKILQQLGIGGQSQMCESEHVELLAKRILKVLKEWHEEQNDYRVRKVRSACRKALINYTCCDDSPDELASWSGMLDGIDEYEVCLDIAESVKGKREMSWAEFGAYKNELRKFVASLQRAT